MVGLHVFEGRYRQESESYQRKPVHEACKVHTCKQLHNYIHNYVIINTINTTNDNHNDNIIDKQ